MLVAAFAIGASAYGQTRGDTLTFEMLQGGPVPAAHTVEATGRGPWTATGGTDWLQLPAAQGTGPVKVAISPDATAKKPGEYKEEVTVTGSDGRKTVPVVLRVVARAPGPDFTYVSEPKSCSRPPGVPLPDLAVCVVPDEKPPGNFHPPAAGGTYVDPNFGAKVRVLAGPTALHGYSTPNPLSATNRYAILGIQDQVAVVETATGRVVNRPKTPFEGVVWDAHDDDTYYYIDGAKVMSHNVPADRSKTVMDYSRAPWRFTKVMNGGSTDTTVDNWMGFWAPAEFSACALDLAHMKTYCGKYDAASVGMGIDPDNGTVLVSKGVDKQSGKRYVWIVGRPAGAMYSVNLAAGKLDFEHLGPELPDWPGNGDGVCQPGEKCMSGDHFDFGEDKNGIQYFFGAIETQQPCELSIYRFQLNKGVRFTEPVEIGGGRSRMLTLFRCGGDTWTDYHVGCAKAAPFCVFSTTYGGFKSERQAADPTPLPRSPHIAEVFVVRTDGTEVRRLMKNRAVPIAGEPANSYWSTPRASISNDGALVVVDSNFGEANQQRVLVVETGLK
jgi:hypothetical protein